VILAASPLALPSQQYIIFSQQYELNPDECSNILSSASNIFASIEN